MLLTVLPFGLVMVTILVADVYSSCILSRTCPCGRSGKNHTRCFETKFQLYSCDSWADCETCEDYNEFCLTCPPGRSGLTCKEVLQHAAEISCKHPGVVENGIIEDFESETERFHVGSELRFQCREGYEIVGPKYLYCLSNGKWSEAPPNCRFISTGPEIKGFRVKREGSRFAFCPLLRPPKSGIMMCSDNGNFRSCTANCLPGFHFENNRLVDKITLNCLQNVWTPLHNFPICKSTRRYCAVPITGKSTYTCTTGMDGTYCDVICNGKNQGRYHCYPGRGWNSTLPICETLKESHLLQVKRVILTGRARTGLTCPDPGTPNGGGRFVLKGNNKYSQHTFIEGDKVFFFCNERNFTLQGSLFLTCKPDSKWEGIPPLCVPLQKEVKVQLEMSCKHPVVPENAIIEDYDFETEQFPVGTELKFVCREGFEIQVMQSKAMITKCLPNLTWSHVPPVCQPIFTSTELQPVAEIYCPHPGVVENGIILGFESETEHFPAGTELRIQCREDYEIEGPKNLYCKRSGEWSTPPNCKLVPATPVQEVSCGHPGKVENGRFEGDESNSRFPLGTELKFYCMEEARREGPMAIICLNNGEWSGKPPTCKIIRPQRREKVATSLPCRHPGMIENGINDYSQLRTTVYNVGDEIKFKCREGYVLEGSDTLKCLRTGRWTSAPPTCRPTKRQQDCGRVFQVVYNTTGTYTRSDWPWTVGISTEIEDNPEKMFCGGALLNSRTVVTAAHCVTGAQNLKLHFGYRRADAEAVLSEQVRNVSRIIIHPEYDDQTHANDLALIKFEPIVYFRPTTQPVCLPTLSIDSPSENLPQGIRTLVTGYGLEFVANNSAAARFKLLELPVESEKKCDAVCRTQGLVSCSPSTFCAGQPQDTRQCIHGGSPVVVLHPDTGRHTLEGLVTRSESARNRWNGKCKIAESYTTFTNVRYFMPFISENLN